MRYFKVTNLNLQSVYANDLGEYAVQYKLNEWAFPKKGKLMCYTKVSLGYDGLERYLPEFGLGEQYRHLFECEVLNPVLHKILYIPSLSFAYTHIGQFRSSNQMRFTSVTNIVTCDAIKLIKEITLSDI